MAVNDFGGSLGVKPDVVGRVLLLMVRSPLIWCPGVRSGEEYEGASGPPIALSLPTPRARLGPVECARVELSV